MYKYNLECMKIWIVYVGYRKFTLGNRKYHYRRRSASFSVSISLKYYRPSSPNTLIPSFSASAFSLPDFYCDLKTTDLGQWCLLPFQDSKVQVCLFNSLNMLTESIATFNGNLHWATYQLTTKNKDELFDNCRRCDRTHDEPCIRHVKCQYFLSSTTMRTRCHHCSHLKDSYLRSALKHCNKSDSTSLCDPSSHTNYRFLSHGQLTEHLRNIHTLLHNRTRTHTRLQAAVAWSIEAESLPLSNEIGTDIKSLADKYSTEILSTTDEDSFQHIFWKQQLKAQSLKNKKSMRWHPLMVKRCLYLHYRSSGAYDTLRKSGLIHYHLAGPWGTTGILCLQVLGFQQLLVRQTKPSASLGVCPARHLRKPVPTSGSRSAALSCQVSFHTEKTCYLSWLSKKLGVSFCSLNSSEMLHHTCMLVMLEHYRTHALLGACTYISTGRK